MVVNYRLSRTEYIFFAITDFVSQTQSFILSHNSKFVQKIY